MPELLMQGRQQGRTMGTIITKVLAEEVRWYTPCNTAAVPRLSYLN